MRIAHALLRLGILTSALGVDAVAQGAPGITFVVDTAPELTPQGAGVVKSLGLRVTHASNRGRIDVLARPARPPVKIGEVVAAPSLAIPGDYYLFDSTGHALRTRRLQRGRIAARAHGSGCAAGGTYRRPMVRARASLAQFPGGINRLLDRPIRVTTVSAITGVQTLRDLSMTTVDPSSLTLPSDYTQTPWPGFAEVPQAMSMDDATKWRSFLTKH